VVLVYYEGFYLTTSSFITYAPLVHPFLDPGSANG